MLLVVRYSFLTKSAKIKPDRLCDGDADSYSFLTKSAKIKLPINPVVEAGRYSFLTKSAKIKLSAAGSALWDAIVSLQNRLK